MRIALRKRTDRLAESIWDRDKVVRDRAEEIGLYLPRRTVFLGTPDVVLDRVAGRTDCEWMAREPYEGRNDLCTVTVFCGDAATGAALIEMGQP